MTELGRKTLKNQRVEKEDVEIQVPKCVSCHVTLLVNSKVRVTPALYLTFKAQIDQGVVSGESDLKGIGN